MLCFDVFCEMLSFLKKSGDFYNAVQISKDYWEMIHNKEYASWCAINIRFKYKTKPRKPLDYVQRLYMENLY